MSAKSRLSTSRIAEIERSLHPTVSTHQLENKHPKPALRQRGLHPQLSTNDFLTRRLRRIYLLAVALPGYAITYYILSNVYPDQIAHTVIPFSFIPLQLALLWGNFWTGAWVALNSKVGLRAALVASCLLALRLQSVQLSLAVVLGIVAVFVLLELGLHKMRYFTSKV